MQQDRPWTWWWPTAVRLLLRLGLGYSSGFPRRPPTMENQMEKKLENEMEVGGIKGIMGIRGFPNYGYLFEFRGPNSKDCDILGSILGSPYFGKLPYATCAMPMVGCIP